MYTNQRLQDLQNSYTEKLVKPLDDDASPVKYTKPTYADPIFSTENDYQEVLQPMQVQNNIKLAELAKDVYNEPDKRLRDWDNYKYQTRFSNKYISTYTKNGNIIFALRGSADLEDLVLDLETPSGLLLNNRLESLLNNVDKAVKEFKGQFGEVVFTGHSLGGLLSQMMNKKIIDSRGITFNAATAAWLEQGKTRRVQNYRIIGDPVSRATTFGQKINLRPKVVTANMARQYKNSGLENIQYPHSIDQFIDRELLEDDPNIYVKERFNYYSKVAQNLIKLGFGAVLYSKLYPILGSRILPAAFRARQTNINQQFSFMDAMGLSSPDLMQPINAQQIELVNEMYNYVQNLAPSRMLTFFNTLLSVFLTDSTNFLRPISDMIADRFEESEDDE